MEKQNEEAIIKGQSLSFVDAARNVKSTVKLDFAHLDFANDSTCFPTDNSLSNVCLFNSFDPRMMMRIGSLVVNIQNNKFSLDSLLMLNICWY